MIEEAHGLLDAAGVPPGPLAARVRALVAHDQQGDPGVEAGHKLMVFGAMDGGVALHCVEPDCGTWVSNVDDKTVDEMAALQSAHRAEVNRGRPSS